MIRTLQDAGFHAFRVGGCVRDRLLGRPIREVDVATGAPPPAVRRLFPKTFAVGESFGVVIVHTREDIDIEVATFRKERGYADGRHPDSIEVSDPETDAARRDFTVNALYYDPLAHTIDDYTGGREDLRRGLLRTIGPPEQRFGEDYLRMLRAVRFATGLRFRLDPETRVAIPALAERLERISAERVFEELSRMLTGPDPARALRMLGDLGLLRVWLPELDAMRGVPQPPEYHPEGDVWEHTLCCLERLRMPSAALAWAVLLHDVGKPPTLEFDERGVPRFPRHGKRSAEECERILRRLRSSGALRKAAQAGALHHMTFSDVQAMRQAKLRRFMARETFDLELELHRIDCLASHRNTDNYVFLLDKRAEFANEPILPDPLLRGEDVLRAGVPKGPEVGRLLNELRERQLNGETTSRDEAFRWLERQVAPQADSA